MEQTQKPSSINRKQFMVVGFFGLLALLVGESIVAMLRFLKPLNKGGFGGPVYAGKVDEFPMDSVTRIEPARAYILRTEQGVLAMWQRCTHLGCAVPWEQARDEFHCPCHGSLFNPVGEVIDGPAPRPLDTFPVVINQDEIWIDTSNPQERSSFNPSQLTAV